MSAATYHTRRVSGRAILVKMGDNATKECSRTTPGDAKITEECFLSVRGRSFECFDCVVKQSLSACDTALECELKLAGLGIQRIHACYYILYHQVRRNTMDPVDRRD